MRRPASPLRFAAAGLALVSVVAFDEALAPGWQRPALRLARRIERHDSLTGLWSGAYRYPWSRGDADAVPFNARLEESGESFSGQIDEPNTYADPSAPRLFASVAGARRGLELDFVKQMDGTGGAAHAIAYSGRVNPDFTRIDGLWTLPGVTGTFFMERVGLEAEAQAARAIGATG